MRTLFYSVVVLAYGMASSVMAAGAYGTIDLGYLGRPGPHSGNGGRFDYDISSGPTPPGLPAGWDFNRYDSPSSAAGGTDGQDDLYTFCIQLSQYVPGNDNAHTYMVDSATIGGNLDLLGDYYFYSAVNDGDGAGGTDGSNGLYNDNEQAGAFQLAVWEIVLGNGDLDISTAPVISGSYSDDAKDLAQSWLNSLAGFSDVLGLQMVFLTNDSFQDQVTQISAVPEATALIVWSFVGGAVGLAVYRRSILARPVESAPLN